jgi:hypothetical protein
MDRRAEWPWSSQEEIEWKAELEEKDESFLEEQIATAVEEGITGSLFVLGPERQGEPGNSEKYSVTT